MTDWSSEPAFIEISDSAAGLSKTRVSRKTQLHLLPPHAHNFISICYLCIMKTEQLLRCIFPEILADYFDVIDIPQLIRSNLM